MTSSYFDLLFFSNYYCFVQKCQNYKLVSEKVNIGEDCRIFPSYMYMLYFVGLFEGIELFIQ